MVHLSQLQFRCTIKMVITLENKVLSCYYRASQPCVVKEKPNGHTSGHEAAGDEGVEK